MSDRVPTGDSTTGVEILPLHAPIPARWRRELVALDAALVDELGRRFSAERWGEEAFAMALPGKWEFSRLALGAGGTTVVGYWIASLRGEDELHTHRVGVSPRARCAGVGRALHAAVSEEAVRCGVRTMTLSISEDNEAALRFYRSLGFVAVVGEDLEWFLLTKVDAKMHEDRRRYLLDNTTYVVLKRDLPEGTT